MRVPWGFKDGWPYSISTAMAPKGFPNGTWPWHGFPSKNSTLSGKCRGRWMHRAALEVQQTDSLLGSSRLLCPCGSHGGWSYGQFWLWIRHCPWPSLGFVARPSQLAMVDKETTCVPRDAHNLRDIIKGLPNNMIAQQNHPIFHHPTQW